MTNYSGTKCPKCENTSFEEVTDSPLKSLIMINFIRCTSCKTAIGIREPESSASMIKELARRLNIIL
jgi:hypothetical protein